MLGRKSSTSKLWPHFYPSLMPPSREYPPSLPPPLGSTPTRSPPLASGIPCPCVWHQFVIILLSHLPLFILRETPSSFHVSWQSRLVLSMPPSCVHEIRFYFFVQQYMFNGVVGWLKVLPTKLIFSSAPPPQPKGGKQQSTLAP